MRYNEFNQPIGDEMASFQTGEMPTIQLIEGQYCRLEKLSKAKHQQDLWSVYNTDSALENWTYLPEMYGPFADKPPFLAYLENM